MTKRLNSFTFHVGAKPAMAYFINLIIIIII